MKLSGNVATRLKSEWGCLVFGFVDRPWIHDGLICIHLRGSVSLLPAVGNCSGVSEITPSLPPLHNNTLCVGSLCLSESSRSVLIWVVLWTAVVRSQAQLLRTPNWILFTSSAVISESLEFLYTSFWLSLQDSLTLISLPRALTDRAVCQCSSNEACGSNPVWLEVTLGVLV